MERSHPVILNPSGEPLDIRRVVSFPVVDIYMSHNQKLVLRWYQCKELPRVSMTLKKWVHDPLIWGNDPIFIRVMETPATQVAAPNSSWDQIKRVVATHV